MSNQGSEGSFGGQSTRQTDGMSGQPIGGNDSNTGSGTTLSQGAEFGGQSSTGQAQSSGGGSDTMTSDENPRGQSGSQGEGFIGSQGSGSDDYLQDDQRSSGTSSAASEKATGGSDFANEGRGVLDEEDEESGSGSTGGGSF